MISLVLLQFDMLMFWVIIVHQNWEITFCSHDTSVPLSFSMHTSFCLWLEGLLWVVVSVIFFLLYCIFGSFSSDALLACMWICRNCVEKEPVCFSENNLCFCWLDTPISLYSAEMLVFSRKSCWWTISTFVSLEEMTLKKVQFQWSFLCRSVLEYPHVLVLNCISLHISS